MRRGWRRKRRKGTVGYTGRLDPRYKPWHTAVTKRDGRTCKFPGCNSKVRIQVHHIRRYAEYKALRYVESNGICLCKKCHTRIKGNEELYAPLFHQIVTRAMRDKDKPNEDK